MFAGGDYLLREETQEGFENPPVRVMDYDS